jgi:hypothetical protein
MNHSDFVHKKFRANKWESELKEFIINLPVTSKIWHRHDSDLKKASEELITLGYYVKYKYGVADSIEFNLNPPGDAVDGCIFDKGKQIESVQIVIAYYDKKEAKQDELIEKGEKCCFGGWRYDRLKELTYRVEQQISKKVKKKYTNIDTLVVGVKGWFVNSVLMEYSKLKGPLELEANTLLANSQFKELAIVDTDLVGKGELWVISNNSFNRTHDVAN